MWPDYLAAQRLLSPMQRRTRVLRAEAERLAALPPDGPVIVAGVTGSIPAAAELIQVVSRLPQGAIVLPGLDRTLDEASFALVRTGQPGSSRSTASPGCSQRSASIARDVGDAWTAAAAGARCSAQS